MVADGRLPERRDRKGRPRVVASPHYCEVSAVQFVLHDAIELPRPILAIDGQLELLHKGTNLVCSRCCGAGQRPLTGSYNLYQLPTLRQHGHRTYNPSERGIAMEGKENRTLKVKLTDDEILQCAKDLIEADEEIERIDAEKKESAENFAELKKEQVSCKAKARIAVKNGEEDREVECEWEPDWKAKQWLLKRTDTGETVEASTMDADDLQCDMTQPDPTRPKQRRRRKSKNAEGNAGEDTPPPAA